MRTWEQLISADEARARLDAAWRPEPRVVQVPVQDALHFRLAEDVRAPESLPAFDRSLMDGFAVRAEDARRGARLRLEPPVTMGTLHPRPLGAGGAARVPTGGALPPNAGCVVPVESCSLEGEELLIETDLAASAHIIRTGDDVRRGDLLLRAGCSLEPQDIGALLALGITQVHAFARPRTGILPTGDELTPPDRQPPPGCIRESNSYALAAACLRAGAVPVRAPAVGDDPELLFSTARDLLNECDLLLFSGGTSVGEKDLVAAAIARLGSPGVLVHGVNVRPGKPIIIALCDGKPVFGLPGNPVSALNSFDLFVIPALRRLGTGIPDRQVPAILTQEVRSADGREDHVRVAITEDSSGRMAQPIGGISAMVSTLVQSDAILVVPAGSPGFQAGDLVQVRLIR